MLPRPNPAIRSRSSGDLTARGSPPGTVGAFFWNCPAVKATPASRPSRPRVPTRSQASRNSCSPIRPGGQTYQMVTRQANSAAAPAAIKALRRRRNLLRRRVISPLQSYLEPYIVILLEKWPTSGGVGLGVDAGHAALICCTAMSRVFREASTVPKVMIDDDGSHWLHSRLRR